MRRRKNKGSGVEKNHVLDCDEALGHCFSYVLPVLSTPPVIDEHRLLSPSSSSSSSSSSLRSISGASVSANATATGCVLESSPNFSALPIQFNSNRIGFDGVSSYSCPITRSGEAAVDGVGKVRERNRTGFQRSSSRLMRSLSERTRKLSVVPVRYSGRRRCSDGIDRTLMNGGGKGGFVEWAHGKAGEDRVHVVVSEENRWLFVGIYDGFNGPGAPEFLVNNLYRAVLDQLRLVFSEEDEEVEEDDQDQEHKESISAAARNQKKKHQSSYSGHFMSPLLMLKNGVGNLGKDTGSWISFPKQKKGEETGSDKFDLDARYRRRLRPFTGAEDHRSVLGALSEAMESIELKYLKLTEAALNDHPEIAIMGSCALVVFVRGEDVYAMNIGDSSALVAQIVEKPTEVAEEGEETSPELTALELSVNHSTTNIEEVDRIKEEHPDDPRCIIGEKVKGRLKLTRAFGVGYLKQPKLNNGLLKILQSEYIGTGAYISASPSLYHHKLGRNDRFLVLSSDGLYQYLTNQEVVSHVQCFIDKFPDGDPAQSLIEELLFRAASNAGMDLQGLLDIPQGTRRKFHDDVTVMVISVEGRIWKSSG